MTARRDPDRLLRTYLEDGPTELPDRSYDAVRAHIENTRQRVTFGPWREAQMSKFVLVGIAAAAVLVVAAVLGLNLMPRSDDPGGVVATPTLAPTPSPSLAATRLPASGTLAPGSYYFDQISPGTRLTLTVPAGWEVDEVFLTKGPRDQPGEVLLTPWWVTHVFADACQWDESAIVDAGETADEIVSALAEQEGREASGPTDVMLGGFPAKRIELTVPADFDTSACTNGNLRYWPAPGPDFSGGLCCNPPGNTDVVYVVGFDDSPWPLAVVARHYPESSGQNRAELQSILDSIVIEP